MEAKAIELFSKFNVNTLYRASDGEYFLTLQAVQGYLTGLGSGAYTTVERVDPLPEVPSGENPITNQPIWVLINNPVVIAEGMRYDGVLSFTSTTVGFSGSKDMTVNKVGAFRVGNQILAVSRKGTSIGMSKYGVITAINANVLTVNFSSFTGTSGLSSDEWDIVLTGVTGSKIYSGAGVPSNSLYLVGDWYINSTTNELYEKTGASTWALRTTFRGSKIYSDAGAPTNSAYLLGDWYINTTTNELYEKTGASAWTLRSTFRGSTIYSGAAAPVNASYLVGDWYINTTTHELYEKTGASAWTLRSSFRGSKMYSGAGVPANNAYLVGDWYTNNTTSDLYEKTGASTWELRQNLRGLGTKCYRATHAISNAGVVINHNLNLTTPTNVIVQLSAADGTNYYYSHRITAHTANSLTITLVTEVGPLNLTVTIMSM